MVPRLPLSRAGAAQETADYKIAHERFMLEQE